MPTRTGLLFLAAVAVACEVAEVSTPGGDVCDAPYHGAILPALLEETSGVAASQERPGVFWTHNDSGGDVAVFALDSTGTVLGRVRLEGAFNRDWEDIAVGPCEPGGPNCLWVAEIGDNGERHPHVAVYRVPEPAPDDTVAGPVDIFRFTYPGGPRDAESLFVTDAGVHVINKGRSHAIELFRLDPPYEPGSTRPLRRLQRLAPPPTNVSAQVTAAAIGADRHVVVRSYTSLRFYKLDGDTLRSLRQADIVTPTQLQGEGVDILDESRFVLTGEARGGRPPTLLLITCDPSRPPADTTD
jgi:hypothetical protein